jgi:hypothetical protein
MGQPVAEVGSIAGLESALETGAVSTVSLAYAADASWLSAWAEESCRRQLVLRDRVLNVAAYVDAIAICDASGDASIFEVAVATVRVVERTRGKTGHYRVDPEGLAK